MAHKISKRKTTKLLIPEFPLEKLFYLESDGQKRKLPHWAEFYIKLGISLASFDQEDTKLISAIAVPTRAYAAAFISAGINYARSFIPQERTDEEYADLIFSLKPGTPVIYRDIDHKKNGIVEKLQNYEGKTLLGIQLEKGQWKYISRDNARLLTIDERENKTLPAHQNGRQITTSSKFINGIFSSNANEFSIETRLECVMVASINLIFSEIEANLIYATDFVDYTGKLSEMIRAYKPNPKGIAYRTCIHPFLARCKPRLPVQEEPSIVIFDGSSAFMKSKDSWNDQNWVIVLDKTDRNLKYAAEHVNMIYMNREEKNPKFQIPSIPEGIEMMVFGVSK